MTKEDFQFRHDNQSDLSDLDAFEQRLRSVKPAPPQTAWDDLPLSHEQQKASTVANPGTAPAHWPRIATHAAATLIGVGIGVICMLMLRPAVAMLPPNESAPQQVAVEQQLPDAAPKYTPVRPPIRRREFQASWPLTPLARDIEFRPWRRTPRNIRPVLFEESTSTSEADQLDKPMSAHELMRELLNSQANLPSSHNQNFSNSL